jgi:nucleoporin NDC1
MNGRSVAFRTLFLALSAAYSFYHLYTDKDKVPYPLRSAVKSEKEATESAVKPAIKQLQDSLYSIAYKSGVSALTLTFPGFCIYIVFFKTWAWNKFFTFARYIHFLPATQRAHPTTLAPFTDLLGRLLVQSFLLVFLWEFTNAAFSAYISQEPLKKGQPLTDDSKDPNGSLLIGLKAKKEFAKVCFLISTKNSGNANIYSRQRHSENSPL